MDITTGSSVTYFAKEEQTIISDNFEEVKYIIHAKSNTVAATKCRKDSLQKNDFCEFVN